jgi:glycerate 2-kinase
MIEYVQVFQLLKLMLTSGMLTQDALSIFLAGVEAVKPSRFIPQHIQLKGGVLNIGSQSIPLSHTNGLYIAAVGKAAAAMALETEKIAGRYITSGVVVTKYHHGTALSHCRTIEAGHPVPDKNSMEGGKAIMELFKKVGKEDVIIMLISGGASALLADFPPGCTLKDMQHTVQLLLDCGAPINEVNTIRKHLSLIKGGQLMQYTAARVFALILSDVPGDDLSVIASGLTVADDSSFGDCKEIIERYHLSEKLPTAVLSWMTNGIQQLIPDTPKQGNPIFKKVFNSIVASNVTALKAATTKSHLLGYTTIILSPDLSGEAAEQAVYFVKELKQRINKKPLCLLWGGETTVTIKGKGK